MNHPLHELHATPQWVVVRLEPLPKGKTNKLPLDYRTGAPTAKKSGGALNPQHWTTYEHATRVAASLGPGHTVGFTITSADPWWCLDLDNALQADGTWSLFSQQMVAALPGTVVEISQSGRGLHVWGRGPVPEHGKKPAGLDAELYSELRFIAAGTGAVGTLAAECPHIAAVVAAYFPAQAAGSRVLPPTGPVPEWRGPVDDDDLIRRAMNVQTAASTFGKSASFRDLWEFNEDVLRATWPDSTERGWDRSRADNSLAARLAFWCGADGERVERLMRRSALARDKWDDNPHYLRGRKWSVIDWACSMCTDVCQDKQPQPGPAPALPTTLTSADLPTATPAAQCAMAPVSGSTFLDPAAQSTLFHGCAYIADYHRVMVPGGRLYKPDQFKAFFGGYTFAMDLRNERTSRNAFEAFTESQCLRPPIMDGTCFRPDLPYGAIVENEGRKRANIWWPANVRRTKGDPTPFLRHLTKLLPVPHDQEITLYYMAGCVQYPGHKFQWFPLLIGTEGNGKSLLSRCVAYAVGQRYTHWPDASKLGSQFNGWVFGKVFAAIEDMNIGDSAEVWEKLKPLVTGENIEVESKGVDQRTDEVCVNFMANSNHKGAHKATANDRRVAHLWTAQQSANDLVRDGMTDDYMSKLYDWLKLQDGFAIVAEYLHTLPIPPQYGLNWLKGRAPRTSSTADAIAAALGPVEQEIQDCVERGEIGFRGGWVSSHFLDKMLQRIGRDKAIPINKRKDLMAALGYTWHPALPQGRSNGTLLPDGVKSKLFVLSARPDLLALGASEAAKRYGQDQGAT